MTHLDARPRLANLRDVGGLRLVEGGMTHHGVLYRSDAPYLGDTSPVTIDWPPALVIDLRSATEVARRQAAWPSSTEVVHHPLFNEADIGHLARESQLLSVYERMLAEVPHRIAHVLDLVASSTAGPILVHCTAGKDRTGVVVASLLLLAGVESDAVVADYRRTEAAMPHVLARMYAVGAATRGAVSAPMTTAPEQGVSMVIDRLTSHPHGPEQWFVDHGAARESAARWRAMIRDQSSPPPKAR